MRKYRVNMIWREGNEQFEYERIFKNKKDMQEWLEDWNSAGSIHSATITQEEDTEDSHNVIKTLELEDVIKTNKIKNKTLTLIKDPRTVNVGNMAGETPCLELEDSQGNIYYWVSDTINHYGLMKLEEGDTLTVTAFTRDNGGDTHLYRVKPHL